MALTSDFKAQLQSPTSPMNGGIKPNQPMTDQQFNQWSNGGQPQDRSVGFAGNKFLGQQIGLLSEAKPLIESTKNADFQANLLKQRVQSGKMTQDRANQLSQGIYPNTEEAAPKMTKEEVIRGGVKAGLDIGSLAIAPGGAGGLAEATLGGAIKQGAIQGLKYGATGGAMQGLGQSIEENQGVGNTIAKTVMGGVTGGAGGAVVGGLLPAGEALINRIKNGPAEVATADLTKGLETAGIKDTTPNYNKKLIGESPIQNFDEKGNPLGTTTPRVSEAKGIGMRTVNSRVSEIEAGKELSKVEGYNPKATSLDKYNLVSSDIAKKGQALETSLKNERVSRPPKKIMKVVRDSINSTAEKSVLLQKTDPIVKSYLQAANKAIKGADGTLAGELQVRKALDTAYEDAGGKYGNNKALDQIHRSARNAINDDMEKWAQNTQVKTSLKQQSNLYRASDVLKDKARAEGGSKFEQFAKAHPVITKSAKAAGRAIGIGAGVHIIP